LISGPGFESLTAHHAPRSALTGRNPDAKGEGRMRAPMDRRRFFTTAGGLVAVFVATSDVVARATPAAAQERSPAPPFDPKALVRALQNGGYVIYFRHAATDQSRTDLDRVDLKNCATQRNLSDKGREQARAIGKAFAALGIKVSKVMSSPYCRCIDTGKLAFGEVTIVPDLEFAIAKSEPEAKRLGAVLRTLLGTKPPPDANTVVVAHSANLKEAVGIWPQPEGAAHVFHPQDDGRPVHIDRVGPEQWPELVPSR